MTRFQLKSAYIVSFLLSGPYRLRNCPDLIRPRNLIYGRRDKFISFCITQYGSLVMGAKPVAVSEIAEKKLTGMQISRYCYIQ